MRPLAELRPTTWLVSLLAALTTWVTLLAWSGFAEYPAGYLVPLLGGCLTVAVVGMLLRTFRVNALLVALAQVVVVLLWLVHREAGDLSVLGWLPTPASVGRLLDALGDSATASQSYAAPVPKTVPEFYPLMILAGSLTAVLVDFLAVGLRRPPLAGLPLLALYTAPVSILDGGIGWLKFGVAALCFLFLIAADEARRLAHWGHQVVPGGRVTDTQTTDVSSQAVWSSARRIGVLSTAVAVVVPLLVPTFSASLFDGNGPGGNGDGDSVAIANPMVDLRRDLRRGADVELVRETTAERDPSYLRISVLDTFDGSAWRPSSRDIPVKQRADGEVTRPPGLDTTVSSSEVPADVQVSQDFRSRWLPTPYPVVAVDAPGDWRYDRDTLDFISAADGQTTAGLRYRVRGLELRPTAAELVRATPAPASVYTPNTSVPRDLPASVKRLAQSVTAGKNTKFEQAVALQNFFRETGGFRYSLARSSGNGTDDLVAFLSTGRDGRVGYCEQFAAAMATMGRTLGIPSRVAVGFLRPAQVDRDTYVYSSHDLHAWPEMYFGGIGWVRFEPTPQGRATDVPDYTTQTVPRADPTASASAPASAPTLNRVNRQADQAAADAAGKGGGFWSGPVVLLALLVLVLALVLLAAPRMLRGLVRRRRWARADEPVAVVEAGWAELGDTARDLGTPLDGSATVRAAAAGLVHSFGAPEGPDDALGRGSRRGAAAAPEAAAALDRLVTLVERARYARTLPAGLVDAERVRADVDVCVDALRAGAGRRRVARATWLPASVLTRRGHARRRPGVGGLLEPGVDRAV